MSKRSLGVIAALAALLATAAPAQAGAIEPLRVFSGDAYDNEMG